MNLASIRLFVRDLPSALRFYSETLGLKLEADGSEWGHCIFRLNDILLVIELVAPDAPAGDQGLVSRFTGLSFRADDIHSEHRRLRDLGVEFTSPPEVQAWGGTMATFKDPSGNQLQLVQY
jgi:catechol 2,3-dioxygenase-like lactoylglutathione lyase family enzyme